MTGSRRSTCSSIPGRDKELNRIREFTQIDVKLYKYFAGNEWREAADEQVFDVHEPYSGKLFARVAAGSRADGRAAVDAAAKASSILAGNTYKAFEMAPKAL